MSDASGVYIAFGSPTLSTSPAYQPIFEVQAWSTDRGRQTILDKTEAGTATVTVLDQTGVLDPTNQHGPYYTQIGPLTPAQIVAVNPTSGITEPIFTGFVETWSYTPDITERWVIVTITLSDAFELANRAETVPDSTGTTVLLADRVDDRIVAVLADMGWPPVPTPGPIFSGNVNLQETVYNPQTTLLSVLQDCADAELPNIANIYIDKWGQWAFHGRFSRLEPQAFSPRIGGMTPPAGNQTINFWDIGDKYAAQAFTICPIADMTWTLDLTNVINAALVTPNGIAQDEIAGQLVYSASSISQYGVRVISISDLLVLGSLPDGDGSGQPARDANAECKIFGQYFIDNYSQPTPQITNISFKTRGVGDQLAAPLWDFICGVEISDVVRVWTNNPGGGGFLQTAFFVEGIHNQVKPLGAGVFDWTMTLDLSPRSWYSVFSGVTYYTGGSGLPIPPPTPGPTPSLSANFTVADA